VLREAVLTKHSCHLAQPNRTHCGFGRVAELAKEHLGFGKQLDCRARLTSQRSCETLLQQSAREHRFVPFPPRTY
jgi:hypothetical protein